MCCPLILPNIHLFRIFTLWALMHSLIPPHSPSFPLSLSLSLSLSHTHTHTQIHLFSFFSLITPTSVLKTDTNWTLPTKYCHIFPKTSLCPSDERELTPLHHQYMSHLLPALSLQKKIIKELYNIREAKTLKTIPAFAAQNMAWGPALPGACWKDRTSGPTRTCRSRVWILTRPT